MRQMRVDVSKDNVEMKNMVRKEVTEINKTLDDVREEVREKEDKNKKRFDEMDDKIDDTILKWTREWKS